MPGKTGKRSKKASPCIRCGKAISGDFNREKEGDYHPECWWKMREDLKAAKGGDTR